MEYYSPMEFDQYQPEFEANMQYDTGGYQGSDYDAYNTGGFGGGNEGYQNWSDWFQPTQQPQFDSSLISEPQGEYGWSPQLAQEPTAPSVGQPGAGGPQNQDEDMWKKLMRSAGGMGIGVLGSAAGAGIKALMAPKEKQQGGGGLPPAPSPMTYKPEPLAALPGTKASPLISGRPTQVLGSQGLKERRPTYGGFSMF